MGSFSELLVPAVSTILMRSMPSLKDFDTIGVIGHLGMVGQTVFRYFQKQGHEVHGYDLRNDSDKEATLDASCIFVCVPTPFDWQSNTFDDSIVSETIAKIPARPGKVVVLKSTVPIGTTDRLQAQHPTLHLLFNPEFLTEATADADFRHPDRQFMGYTEQSRDDAPKVMHLLPASPHNLTMVAKEAELLKYINNLHGVLESLESNHYYEVCEREGLDYDRVMQAATTSKRMSNHYRVVWHRGHRGIKGKCFPKDLAAWIGYCRDHDIPVELFEAARQMNLRILESQNLTEPKSEAL
jgi:UDPglucose 6-dehydrogenase